MDAVLQWDGALHDLIILRLIFSLYEEDIKGLRTVVISMYVESSRYF